LGRNPFPTNEIEMCHDASLFFSHRIVGHGRGNRKELPEKSRERRPSSTVYRLAIGQFLQ